MTANHTMNQLPSALHFQDSLISPGLLTNVHGYGGKLPMNDFFRKDSIAVSELQLMKCRGDFGNNALASYLKHIWQLRLMR
jgi:hypothetical protein